MVEFIGRSQSLALFSNGTEGAVVDTTLNLVISVGDSDVLSELHPWEATEESFPKSVLELASGAMTTLDINVITASGRMYTIPDGVKAEAKKSLEWHKEHHRGGTPVGLNTARTLARGGQIGIEKVRHIAKYFPRHEVDKKGKGWEPGEDGFPSNGRIAWALWGGDSAWRWARAIVERENKKSVTAGGYALPSYLENSDAYKTEESYIPDVNAFKDAFELDEHSGPEFLARVRLDGSGLDRLYKVETDGSVHVWDDMGWDNLGHVNGDIWTYDNALDDEYDDCPKDHVLIDPNSAVVMSALFQEDPYRKISLDDIDPEEASLVSDAIPAEDWKMADYAMTAAGEGATEKNIKPSAVNQDGNYTPEERSALAKNQTRDATGKFAAQGSRVVVGNDGVNGRGVITGLDKATGSTTVQLDNGNVVNVPAKLTAPEKSFQQPAPSPSPAYGKPLDVDGILGEPKSPVTSPNVQLPGTLPPMSSSDLHSVVNDWAGYVADQRARFKPLTNQNVRDYAKATGQPLGPHDIRPEGKIATVKDGKIVTQKTTPAAADRANAGKPRVNPAAQTAKIEAKRDATSAGRAPAPAPLKKPDSAFGPGKIPTGKPAEPKGSNIGPGKVPYAPNVPSAPKGGNKNIIQQAGENFVKTWNKVDREGFAPPPVVKKAVGDLVKGLGSPASRAKDPITSGRIAGQRAQRSGAPSGASPDAVERRQKDADKVVSGNREKLRQARNADRKAETKASSFDKEGRYVVQKGDSLWSIADKNKPAGKSTAEYWNEVMKANPKNQFKSGNPSLIYSGERVNLPGQKPVNPKAQAAETEARRDKATAGRAPAPAPSKAQVEKSEARRDKATASRKPTIDTKAQRDKIEAKRDNNAGNRGTATPSKIDAKAQRDKIEAKKDTAAAGRKPAPAPAKKPDSNVGPGKIPSGKPAEPKGNNIGPGKVPYAPNVPSAPKGGTKDPMKDIGSRALKNPKPFNPAQPKPAQPKPAQPKTPAPTNNTNPLQDIRNRDIKRGSAGSRKRK